MGEMWSSPKFVNAPTVNSTPSVRWYLSAWLDASSAQSQYLAAREQLNATQTSFELTEEQFYLGMKNTVEMLTAKNNWLSAQQEELQARFMALLNIKLLDYYENKPLTLD